MTDFEAVVIKGTVIPIQSADSVAKRAYIDLNPEGAISKYS
jgi:hypothetical protein